MSGGEKRGWRSGGYAASNLESDATTSNVLDQGLFKALGTMKLPSCEFLQKEEGRFFKCG